MKDLPLQGDIKKTPIPIPIKKDALSDKFEEYTKSPISEEIKKFQKLDTKETDINLLPFNDVLHIYNGNDKVKMFLYDYFHLKDTDDLDKFLEKKLSLVNSLHFSDIFDILKISDITPNNSILSLDDIKRASEKYDILKFSFGFNETYGLNVINIVYVPFNVRHEIIIVSDYKKMVFDYKYHKIVSVEENWYKDEKLHSINDKPAVISWSPIKGKFVRWYTNGKYYRTGYGPDSITWHNNGVKKSESWIGGGKYMFSRTDGPAITEWHDNGQKAKEDWYVNGIHHRIDGPAYIKYDISGNIIKEEWYKNGVQIDKSKIKWGDYEDTILYKKKSSLSETKKSYDDIIYISGLIEELSHNQIINTMNDIFKEDLFVENEKKVEKYLDGQKKFYSDSDLRLMRLYSFNGDGLINSFLLNNRKLNGDIISYYKSKYTESFSKYMDIFKLFMADSNTDIEVYIDTFVERLDKIFLTKFPTDVILFRGIKSDFMFKKGDIFMNNTYISCSYSVDVAIRFSLLYKEDDEIFMYQKLADNVTLFEIIVPSGVGVCPIVLSTKFDTEKEILINRNTYFYVKDIIQYKNIKKVTLILIKDYVYNDKYTYNSKQDKYMTIPMIGI